MEGENDGNVREIDHKIQDFFAAAITGDKSYLSSQVEESVIAKFCNGCDRLQGNGVCKLDENDQARYAARQQCGWASVNEVRGEMTADGFKAFSS